MPGAAGRPGWRRCRAGAAPLFLAVAAVAAIFLARQRRAPGPTTSA
ncbi:Loki-CTERM sorting domain-containing protein [Streptomyces cyaneofuscatus]